MAWIVLQKLQNTIKNFFWLILCNQYSINNASIVCNHIFFFSICWKIRWFIVILSRIQIICKGNFWEFVYLRHLSLFSWTKCIIMGISSPPPGIGEGLGVILATVPETDPLSCMKYKTNLYSSIDMWQTVTLPILSTLLIITLQQYRSISIDKSFVSFKIFTCWCNEIFFQDNSL